MIESFSVHLSTSQVDKCAKNKRGLTESIVPRRSRPRVAAQPHKLENRFCDRGVTAEPTIDDLSDTHVDRDRRK